MKNFLKIGAISLLSLVPAAAFAAPSLVGGQGTVLGNIGALINQATPIVVALGLLAFFWGLVQYIFQSGNDDKRKKGLQIMIWGIIALFVMLSVFGIINALQATFGVGNGNVGVPTINGTTGTQTSAGATSGFGQ